MKDTTTLISELKAFAAANNHAEVERCAVELDISVLEADELAESHLALLEGLLLDDAFVRGQDSWHIVHFLDGIWEQLTTTQRERLRATVVQVFDSFGDPTGPFVVAEILGGRYADVETFAVLTMLGERARLPARALVPHGLETLARTTPDPVLRRRAVEALHLLATSVHDEVREEADLSLERLSRDPQ
jgi:hypothetical protein